MIQWIRDLEQWVWRKTAQHPGWNVLTWAGHGLAVAGVIGIAGFGGAGLAALGGTSAAGYYFWRELVELYRGKHPKGSKVWVWLDHAMDALVPIVVAIWLA